MITTNGRRGLLGLVIICDDVMKKYENIYLNKVWKRKFKVNEPMK